MSSQDLEGLHGKIGALTAETKNLSRQIPQVRQDLHDEIIGVRQDFQRQIDGLSQGFRDMKNLLGLVVVSAVVGPLAAMYVTHLLHW